jgi:hypothetical protein
MNKGKVLFTALLAAYEAGDDAEIDELRRRLVELGNPVRVSTSEDVEWSEPDEGNGVAVGVGLEVGVSDEDGSQNKSPFGIHSFDCAGERAHV